jgi:glycosyltransferase involved in cell wall biosynthesis
MVALSILLLTRNGSRDLEQLLPALSRQQQVAPFEIVAVDSASTDGTLPLLLRFGVRVLQIKAENFHHARTRNLAAEQARGDILIFLSQDAVPASDLWLSRLISNFSDPKVGAVYGRQLPKAESLAERRDTFDVVYGAHRIVKDPAHRNGLGYRFYHFSDVNAAIRRHVWEQTRFPEDLKVFEDLGIAKLILDGDWKIVYEPEASVIHSHHHSTIGLFKRYFDIGYTLKRLSIWDAPGTRKSIFRDAWKILQGKMQLRVASANGAGDQKAGEGIQQHMAKFLGFVLGINQAWLPNAVKRHLSAYRVFG